MSVKISELPLLSTLSDNDILAGVDTSENVTSKVELATLKNCIDTNTQYTARTNIDITENVISAPNVYNKNETDEQIKQLQEKLDAVSTIYNAFPTTSDEGESMTLEDTAESKLKKIDLQGNTSQDGTPTPTAPIEVNVVSGDNTIDICGKNLSTMSSMTTTSGGNYNASTGFFAYVQSGKTYTLSLNIASSNTSTGFTEVRCYSAPSGGTNQGTVASFNRLNGGGNITKTFTSSYNGYLMFSGAGMLANSEVFTEIQIEVGSTATTYEPYIGNSYPIHLPVENLHNSTTDIIGKVIASNGDLTNNNAFLTSDYIPCLPNTKYTISYVYDSTVSGAEDLMRVGYYDNSKNFISRPISANKPWIITTPSDVYYIRLSYHIASHAEVQVEKGTQSNSYTEYGQTPIELCKIGDYQDSFRKSTGKNLFDVSTVTNTYINSNTGAPSSNYAWRATPFESNILPNTTYNFSWTSNNGYFQVVITYYDKNKVFISGVDLSQNNTYSKNITTPANFVYYRISYSVSVEGVSVTRDNIQLEKGSVATDCEPYGKDKWYLYEKVGKIVLNGSEVGWNGNSPATGVYRFYKNFITECLMVYDDTARHTDRILCDYFRRGTENEAGKIYQYTGRLFFQMNSNEYSSVSDFTTWLTSNNVTVYYVLAKPRAVLIPASLQKQLDELELATAYDPQTNISQENNDKPFILDVEAIKKLT